MTEKGTVVGIITKADLLRTLTFQQNADLVSINDLNISVLYTPKSGTHMSTSCESVARHILPLYRSFVAKKLIEKYNYTQVQAAKKLGTTQPAISQYMASKRGHKGIPNYDEIAPLVQKAAAEVAKRIAAMDISPKEFSASFCELCKSLRENKKIQ